jgi:transposase
MTTKYRVEMTNDERQELEALVSRGKSSARQIRRAHALLMSADGKSDQEIAELLRVNPSTVYNTRQRWAEERLSRGLLDKPKAGRPTKLNGKQEAYLVALACTDAPEGRERWTLQLLADKLVQLSVIDEPVSYETVRTRLKKRDQALA